MIIRSLVVQNIRSHEKFEGSFAEDTTIIIGKNGCGKTSLLEAISIGSIGKSFKGSDSELLRTGAEWYRIDIETDEQIRTVKYQPTRPSGAKQFVIDNKTSARMPKAARRPFVLFEPDDMRLIHGSPARRRRYIDGFAAQIYPDYRRIVLRYEKILAQRNKLLKDKYCDNDKLFAWNVGLAKYGAEIIHTRSKLLERINKELEPTYGKIAKTKDEVTINYTYPAKGNIEQRLLIELERNVEKDKILGSTSTGPHRHDVAFDFNGKLAASTMSRGETRTIVLALKFIEVELVEEVIGEKPIVLLDDVFSELDEIRQTQLASNFRDNQIIMTSVAVPKTLSSAKVIRLK